MNTIGFLVEWAIRSSLLIGVAAAMLWALRVKDSSIRLAAWTAVLAGSLLIPAISASLPVIPVYVAHATPAVVPSPAIPIADAVGHATLVASKPNTPRPNPFDWPTAAIILYTAIATGMLLRLGVGLLGSLRLLRSSNATERDNIRESERIAAPVTLGIVRPRIVLPMDWREWDAAKLDAVLAHERSHIERHDPLVQMGSAIHRALLWFSPFTWFLHSRIVQAAEEASDDAAVSVTQDRASYAELLLDFVQRGVRIRSAGMLGVPMARYGRADKRIHRILDSTVLSQGVTKRVLATIMLIGVPLAYVAATAKAQSPAAPKQAPPAPVIAPQPKTAVPLQPRAKAASPSGELRGLGTVTASMVTVRPQIEGRLESFSFKEGQPVTAGDVLAVLGETGRDADLAVEQSNLEIAEDRLADLKKQYNNQREAPQLAVQLEAAQLAVQDAAMSLQHTTRSPESTQIKSPISGVAGLRLIDPGNMIHPGEAIVVIAQIQPISVVFTIPEDLLPQIRKRLNAGDATVVEAWTRDEKTHIATGVLTATDNQIDEQTGTIKLKATFDNKDNALFPNQFVNVRLKTR